MRSNGGLSRLLRGRQPGDAEVPDPVRARTSPTTTRGRLFKRWEAAGGPVVEDSVIDTAPTVAGRVAVGALRCTPLPPVDRHHLAAHLVFGADPRRRRRRCDQRAGGQRTRRRDRGGRRRGGSGGRCRRAARRWPTCRAAPTFGSLVHAVLETADPSAAELAAELEEQVRRAYRRGGRSTSTRAVLASALMPMHDTPLGPLASGLTLRQIGSRDQVAGVGLRDPVGRRRHPR